MKKSLCMALAAVLTFCFAAPASAASFADLSSSSPYYEAVTFLSQIDVIHGDSDGNFYPDNPVTRAEMAALICRMRGIADPPQKDSDFSDVPKDAWYSAFLSVARQLEIIDGYPDGTFRPDEPVLYEDVIKMIVCLLGYGPSIDGKGGYPTGCLIIATERGITKGISFSSGSPAPRGMVAVLLYQATKVPVMEQVGFGRDSIYAIMDGKNGVYKTLLSYFTEMDLPSVPSDTVLSITDYEGERILDETNLLSCKVTYDEEQRHCIFTFQINEKGRLLLKEATEKIKDYEPENAIVRLVYNTQVLAVPAVTGVIDSNEIAVSCPIPLAQAQIVEQQINEMLKIQGKKDVE